MQLASLHGPFVTDRRLTRAETGPVARERLTMRDEMAYREKIGWAFPGFSSLTPFPRLSLVGGHKKAVAERTDWKKAGHRKSAFR